ncbi:HlyD family secretion protein [Shewanella amazonensis]|uniref:Multidrug resistance efflux pump-like protein n=1 Tax=Shewanella amazonensis (strain ATCC BAA-1098 / SB2B) TaxID=326297 RepID=A1S5M0_SHEAM|nr:efflux RND transporter periplasmic adaptor subunit [Shewanella amazonensis]ABL99676.1 multidrug resistance efflux pump-like protein [Shewanella amazonensis SB2B]
MVNPKPLIIALALLPFFSPAAKSQALCGSGEQSLLLTGSISSAKSQPFAVPKAGDSWRHQIQWLFPEGKLARVGDTIVIFDKSQIANQIEQLEASLLRVKAQEQSQGIDLESALLSARFEVRRATLAVEKARLDASVPAEYIAAKEYADNQFKLLQANTELEKANQALKEAIEKRKSSLEQLAIEKRKAEVELSAALAALDALELKAEIAGPVIIGRDWNEKKYQAGDTVQFGRQIASIPALDGLEASAWANEVDVDKIRLGQAVCLSLDAKPGLQVQGKVANIGRQAVTKSAWGQSKWFRVEVALSDTAGLELSPGMSVMVEVHP